MTTIPIPNPFKIRRPRAARPVSVYDIRPVEDGLVNLDQIAEYGDLGFTEIDGFEVLVHRMAEGDIVVSYSEKLVKVIFFFIFPPVVLALTMLLGSSFQG